jgi:hypothetical protein
MFFKRLSRGSRSNSYAEDDHYDSPRSATEAKLDKYIHDSPRQSTSQHNTYNPASGSGSGFLPTPTKETQRPESQDKNAMFSRSQPPNDPYGRPQVNALANGRPSMQLDSNPMGSKAESAPDLLTRAFNEAVRPFSDKIEQLESEVADLRAWVDQLEQQRSEVHGWIDKRGLRPGKILSISIPNRHQNLKTNSEPQTYHLQSQRSWMLSQTQPPPSTPNWTARSQLLILICTAYKMTLTIPSRAHTSPAP